MKPVLTINDIQQLAVPLFEQYDVARAAVFGSFIHGETKKKSEVDILIAFRKTYDLFDIIGLKQELEEVLGRKVDLFTFKALDGSRFGDDVIREARTIYEKS